MHRWFEGRREQKTDGKKEKCKKEKDIYVYIYIHQPGKTVMVKVVHISCNTFIKKAAVKYEGKKVQRMDKRIQDFIKINTQTEL